MFDNWADTSLHHLLLLKEFHGLALLNRAAASGYGKIVFQYWSLIPVFLLNRSQKLRPLGQLLLFVLAVLFTDKITDLVKLKILLLLPGPFLLLLLLRLERLLRLNSDVLRFTEILFQPRRARRFGLELERTETGGRRSSFCRRPRACVEF